MTGDCFAGCVGDEGIQFTADGQQQKTRMFRSSSIELLVNLDESLDSDAGSGNLLSHQLGKLLISCLSTM